jgi:hypothetical protein
MKERGGRTRGSFKELKNVGGVFFDAYYLRKYSNSIGSRLIQ